MKNLSDFDDPIIERCGCKPIWINSSTFNSLKEFASDNQKDVKNIVEYLVVFALNTHQRDIKENISFDLENL